MSMVGGRDEPVVSSAPQAVAGDAEHVGREVACDHAAHVRLEQAGEAPGARAGVDDLGLMQRRDIPDGVQNVALVILARDQLFIFGRMRGIDFLLGRHSSSVLNSRYNMCSHTALAEYARYSIPEQRASNACSTRPGTASMPLSPTAQKVQDMLVARGFTCTVIEHAESTRTAQEAADRAGCQLGQIIKSLIFKGQQSGKPILVLTSGANRVNEKQISAYAGEAIGRADADFVRTVTGFAIGGVPPFGHAQPMETYMDEDLLQYPTVWAAAGTPNAIFELTPGELIELTQARIARIK